MSRSDVQALGAELDEHQSDFVLDIRYQDSRRVGSFLSQFDDAGLLERLIEREGVTKGKKRGFKFNLGGGATWLGTGGSATIGLERGPGEQGSEGAERIYDPFWTNTLTLLDFLTAAELIQPHISQAKIGQFVKVSGHLRVYDLATVKRLWDLPTVKRQRDLTHNSTGNRRDRRRQGTIEGPRSDDAIEMGIEILKTLPHVICARIDDSTGLRVWSSLREGGLTGSASDLFLKHGPSVAGIWSMVGILDAEPDGDEITIMNLTESESAVALLTNDFSHLLDTLGVPTRTFLGRPMDAYGMTPLIIYREVSG